MFTINDDLSIYLTRGDIAFFTVTAEENDKLHVFLPNDVVRFKVTERRNCENVVMQKDFLVKTETDRVEIVLDENDTKIGDVISKPTDYWYEVELNPFTNPQTIIGYDEDGAKILKLFPEGKDMVPVEPEEIPPVDMELSLTSERPIQNQAVARALIGYEERVALAEQRIDGYASDAEQAFEQAIDTYSTNKVEETENTINTEADNAVARVQESSSSAEADADRAEDAAERAEASARRAEAVTDLEIDTALNKNSYNPVANKPVAEAIENCLPKTGGKLNSGTNNPLELVNLTSDTVRLRFSGTSGNLGYIGVDGKGRFVVISSEDWVTKDILHTGNKPKMTYTGNGDGATRTIAVNAAENIGMLMVREMGSRNFAIVTNSGYIGKSGSTIVAGHDVEESYGNLVLKTTNDLFNTSGKTYYCFAL